MADAKTVICESAQRGRKQQEPQFATLHNAERRLNAHRTQWLTGEGKVHTRRRNYEEKEKWTADRSMHGLGTVFRRVPRGSAEPGLQSCQTEAARGATGYLQTQAGCWTGQESMPEEGQSPAGGGI